MLRVQVEIRGRGGASELPSVLLLDGSAAPSPAEASTALTLRLLDDGAMLQRPEGEESRIDFGQWHKGEGWEIRITRSEDSPDLSLAENPGWAEREIEITTLNEDKSLTQLRRALPSAGKRLVLGRDKPHVDIFVPDEYISRKHLELAVDGDEVIARDMGSLHGTRLNGNLLETPTALHHGDELRLGRTMIRCLFYQDELMQALLSGDLPSEKEARSGGAARATASIAAATPDESSQRTKGQAAAAPPPASADAKAPPAVAKAPEPPAVPPAKAKEAAAPAEAVANPSQPPPQPAAPAKQAQKKADEEWKVRPAAKPGERRRPAWRDWVLAATVIAAILAGLGYVVVTWMRST